MVGIGLGIDLIILIQYNGSADFENVWNDLLVLAIDGKYIYIWNIFGLHFSFGAWHDI